ncbi:hypothetical protein [Treponema primitia]|uniref:hypothetical protein n=1 Tax=Treponema primitia TaxID=88058 RepID=UPI00397F861D
MDSSVGCGTDGGFRDGVGAISIGNTGNSIFSYSPSFVAGAINNKIIFNASSSVGSDHVSSENRPASISASVYISY